MKKLIFLFIFLFSMPLFGQGWSFLGRSEPRFIIERFDTAEEAVQYANNLPIKDRPSVQFLTEFNARSTSPASYVVVFDRNAWLRQMHSIRLIGEWVLDERLDLQEAARLLNSASGRYPRDFNLVPNLVGYWNPHTNPHSTTVTMFFLPTQEYFAANCQYNVVDVDLGSPESALEHLKDMDDREVDRVEFVTQFNVGSSVFGSLWLVTGDCIKNSYRPKLWQLVETDKNGHTFSIESAVDFVVKNDFKFARFVSFTSPSQHDSRSRVLIFFQN